MKVTKSLEIKVVSIGPVKVRPDASAISASVAASVEAARRQKPTSPRTAPLAASSIPPAKDGIQVVLAFVDDAGRFISRRVLTFCDGKATLDRTVDLGASSQTLDGALAKVMAELDSYIGGLSTTGKL